MCRRHKAAACIGVVKLIVQRLVLEAIKLLSLSLNGLIMVINYMCQAESSGERKTRSLTGQVNPKANRMGLVKLGSELMVSGTLKELEPNTGVTALP